MTSELDRKKVPQKTGVFPPPFTITLNRWLANYSTFTVVTINFQTLYHIHFYFYNILETSCNSLNAWGFNNIQRQFKTRLKMYRWQQELVSRESYRLYFLLCHGMPCMCCPKRKIVQFERTVLVLSL